MSGTLSWVKARLVVVARKPVPRKRPESRVFHSSPGIRPGLGDTSSSLGHIV